MLVSFTLCRAFQGPQAASLLFMHRFCAYAIRGRVGGACFLDFTHSCDLQSISSLRWGTRANDVITQSSSSQVNSPLSGMACMRSIANSYLGLCIHVHTFEVCIFRLCHALLKLFFFFSQNYSDPTKQVSKYSFLFYSIQWLSDLALFDNVSTRL